MLANINRQLFGKFWLLIALGVAGSLAGCGGGGAAGTTATPGTSTPGTPTVTAASLNLTTSLTSVKSDDSQAATLTATALDSSNAALAGVTVTFAATGGRLSASSVVTDSNGQARVNFSSGSNDPTNRTVTVTATSGGNTPNVPIKIVGSSVTLNASGGTNLPSNGATTGTLLITAKDAGGTAIASTPVTLTFANNPGDGTATLSATSGPTDINGQLSVTVTGTGAGPVTVVATALGATATQAYTISPAGSTFGITAPASDPAAMTTNGTLVFTTSAPAGTTAVRFSTALGTWTNNGLSVYDAPVAGGTATATLQVTVPGIASVMAQALSGTTVTATATRSVAVSAVTPATITLQSTVSILPLSTGGTANSTTLKAIVRDPGGLVVGNAPVVFTIDPATSTGGGESISPVISLTSDGTGSVPLGEAQSTFTSGSISSTQTGVRVVATVVGTGITAFTYIVVGGTAGSVNIGQASVISVVNPTEYDWPMSVLVSDSNGNPLTNQVVSLSAWPTIFSTGTWARKSNTPSCIASTDDGIASYTLGDAVIGGITGDFLNEDTNENLINDGGEDRKYYSSIPYGYATTLAPNAACGTVVGGITVVCLEHLNDGILTPPNSIAGSLPATVTTNAQGVANFNLRYQKSSAAWVVVRITARTLVQGTEAKSSISFRLPAEVGDVNSCSLPSSPFGF